MREGRKGGEEKSEKYKREGKRRERGEMGIQFPSIISSLPSFFRLFPPFEKDERKRAETR